jgi:hypothetical protein
MPSTGTLLNFLLPGFLITIAIEAPILLLLLSKRHAMRERCIAGVMLTACTYPIVVLVLPELLWRPYGYAIYISVAESFAPLAECLIFYFCWIRSLAPPQRVRDNLQDFAAIVIANLTSWLGGSYLIENVLSDFFR